jgi:hypothetical protein
MRLAAALSTLVLVVGFAVAEDKVVLKDGRVMIGKILSVTQNDIQIEMDGEKARVPRAAIDKVERDGVLLDLDAVNRNPDRPGRPARPPKPVPRSRVYEATPALLTWLDLCAAQLAADDEGVRASVTAALISAGKVAFPALKTASENDDRIVTIAARIRAQIERKEQRMAPPAPRANAATSQAERIASLGKALKLTDAQEPKFTVIMDDYRRMQSELRQSIRSGDVEMIQAGEKSTALRIEAEKQLAEVLTAEQMQTYKRLHPRPESRQTLK